MSSLLPDMLFNSRQVRSFPLLEFHAIAHCEPLETLGGLRYEEEPLCHLNLTFDLIYCGSTCSSSTLDHDFQVKHTSSREMQGRWLVAGIRTTVPLEWDQLWLMGSDFLHSPPFFLLMCTSTWTSTMYFYNFYDFYHQKNYRDHLSFLLAEIPNPDVSVSVGVWVGLKSLWWGL